MVAGIEQSREELIVRRGVGALSVPLLVSGVLSHWGLSPAPGQSLMTLTGVGGVHRRL